MGCKVERVDTVGRNTSSFNGSVQEVEIIGSVTKVLGDPLR